MWIPLWILIVNSIKLIANKHIKCVWVEDDAWVDWTAAIDSV